MVTYAIGDIHGCLEQLLRLLDRCAQHGGDQPARYVFVGDYIDRGPDSCGVVALLSDLQHKMPGSVICLRGNHEQLLLRALREEEAVLEWFRNGGGPTLASYGVLRAEELPAKHLAWIASLPTCFDDGLRYFVHAGVNPGRPLDQQNENDQLWIREPFLFDERDYGRLIVHGHTPIEAGMPDLRAHRLNLDTGAVYGGPLTAAIFTDEQVVPIAFLTDRAE